MFSCEFISPLFTLDPSVLKILYQGCYSYHMNISNAVELSVSDCQSECSSTTALNDYFMMATHQNDMVYVFI